jgi:DNA helicase-2/ATP-dependent DNA helicase PcrA
MLEATVLTQKLNQLRDSLRPGQRPLADWSGGEMAVSAVPGAGKSHSLAVAAAIAIARHQLQAQRQLIIVTYTRSAAAAIKSKVRERLQELALPAIGFSVQTLHGLALQIANRHSEVSGLNLEQMTLITPNPGHRIIRDTVEQWIENYPTDYRELLTAGIFDGEETEKLRRQSVLRTEVLPSLTFTVVREAKSSGLLPQAIWELSNLSQGDGILAIAAGLYEQYQSLMQAKDWIDYDDMILAALRVLDQPDICHHWQQQIFGVFEDEAQDSSPLQEALITRLASNAYHPETPANLIRVGDPNQAINSTFTPADPLYFNWFCEQCDRQDQFATMDQAGRSNPTIIEAANFVLHWVNQNWQKSSSPSPPLLVSPSPPLPIPPPFRCQNIRPVASNDPQPNPPATGQGLELCQPEDIFQSVTLIRQRAIALLKANPDHNLAILVRENRQAQFLAQQLEDLFKNENIPVYEVGGSDRFSQIPKEILTLLKFIDRPHSPDFLKAALGILQEKNLIPAQDINRLAVYPEQFLYPSPLESPTSEAVNLARRYCCNLLRAKIELPHYQLMPFLGMTLNYDGSQLATLQKLSERIQQEINQQNSLKNTLNVLQEIVNSERFEGIEEDSDDLYTRSGQITIITMHKAKGLDWDYVFIPFLHQDIIPGQLWVPTAAKFLGDYTLAEVARAQIRTAIHYQHIHHKSISHLPDPLTAWETAKKLKEAEEYRLLYVAMTRAKRLLWLAAEQQAPFRWSIFQGDKNPKLEPKQPCPAWLALQQV